MAPTMLWSARCWTRTRVDPARMATPLKPWASDPARTRGRRHAEVAAPTRDDFQRDRDRIVHCTAFRRLVYKTQVEAPVRKQPHSMRLYEHE